MKLYFYSAKSNMNSYFILDENTKEGLFIDPTTINQHFIKKIEIEGCKLSLALLTNTHIKEINNGISSLKTLYDFPVYSPYSLSKIKNVRDSQKDIKACDKFYLSSLCVECFSIRHSYEDVCIYKIGNAIFTGIVFLDNILPVKTPSFIEEITHKRIKELLFSFDETSFVFPLSGPPSTIKALKFYSNF